MISSKTFKQWLLIIGKSERTAKSYAGAIENAISQIAIESGLATKGLYHLEGPSQASQLSQQIQQLPAFKQKNAKGKSMYSAALNQYVAFLNDVNGQQLREDIEQILTDGTTTQTDKTTLVNTRIGQGRFRSQLIEQWNGCAVTGYRDVRFLVASHIKPWHVSNNKERLSPYNGLLLLPNIDKVFDLGYISFAESGKILISEQLEEYSGLGLNSEMHIALHKQHQDYMAYHREEQFHP